MNDEHKDEHVTLKLLTAIEQHIATLVASVPATHDGLAELEERLQRVEKRLQISQ